VGECEHRSVGHNHRNWENLSVPGIVRSLVRAIVIVPPAPCRRRLRPLRLPLAVWSGHMLEHKRAVDLMVQDLTVPSTSAWNEGTAIYSELIQSCASCHALHHKVWGPRRQ